MDDKELAESLGITPEIVDDLTKEVIKWGKALESVDREKVRKKSEENAARLYEVLHRPDPNSEEE